MADEPSKSGDGRTPLLLQGISTFATVVATLVTIAGFVLGLVATDTIEISRPDEQGPAATVTAPPRTVVETVTVTAPVAADPGSGPCNGEPNEDRRSANRISLGSCEAMIETVNDRDWFLFESPAGGQVELTVQKEEGAEEFGTIIVTVFDGASEVESEHVAADEPLVLPYTLESGSEMAIEVMDGCGPPGGCGLDAYTIELDAFG